MSRIEEIVGQLSSLTVLEAAELSKRLEQEWGVSAAVAVAAPAAASAGAGAVAEAKTEFDVILTSFGDNKINVIKEMRAITGLGLAEAKALVEGAGPSHKIKEAVSEPDAKKIKEQLEAAGAKVEIK